MQRVIAINSNQIEEILDNCSQFHVSPAFSRNEYDSLQGCFMRDSSG